VGVPSHFHGIGGNVIEKEAKEHNFRSINTDFRFEQIIKESLESIST
jgi:hypothetical protein